ncbi:MAG: sulfate transporter CysZ [Methylococcales bacterium]|nr:sulfate transporter CysZ [Methylococcales bacterium]
MMAVNNGNNPLFALHCLWQGVKLLRHKDLRAFLVTPLLINLVLYSIMFALGYYTVSALIAQLIPDWLSWLTWILWPLFFISFMVLGFFSFTLLANLLAAPFYGRLSAKTLEILSGVKAVGPEAPWYKVFYGELGRVKYLLLRILPLLALFAIPVVNLVAPVLWTLFAAWGMAMEFMSYPLEERGLLFAEQKRFMQQNRLGMLSFGGAIGFGLTLPVVNLLITQAAVIGATIYVNRLNKAEDADGIWR